LGSLDYTLSVAAPVITLSPVALPDGAVHAAYSQTVTAAGGTGPYTFAVTGGTPPAGLSLSSAGVLSGTPAAEGTSSFTITATDAYGSTGSLNYTLSIQAALIPTLSPAGIGLLAFLLALGGFALLYRRMG
ncbi:MAG: Ig domain-containing protein, partial [Acidobacteria bacterium]|nr:Ig domain-containing protein [Acidobacteriota bacterium]